jgi:hypothetical protein
MDAETNRPDILAIWMIMKVQFGTVQTGKEIGSLQVGVV